MKSSSNQAATGVTTVTPERKEELLLEARKTRIAWIQSSSFPFLESTDNHSNAAIDTDICTNFGEYDNDDDDNDDDDKDKDGMKVIWNVCQEVKLPSAMPIIDLLLEKTNHDNSCRKESLSSTTTTTTTTTLSARELSTKLQSKLTLSQRNNNNNNNNNNTLSNHNDTLSSYEISMEQYMDKTDDQIFLFYYKELLEKLCLPECADIVQGMRHFERSFHDLSTQLQSKIKKELEGNGHGGDGDDYDDNDDDANDMKNKRKYSTTSMKSSTNNEGDHDNMNKSSNNTNTTSKKNANHHLDTLATGLQNYIAKLYESLASHIAWRDNVISSETKMMLETFIYSKCHLHIQPILSMVEVDSNQNDDDDDDNGGIDGDSGDIHSKNEKRQILRICDDEAMMRKRLEFLQFVEPKHLDMHPFISSTKNTDDIIPWQSKLDLSKPISHVKSLDVMYSPAQMLRCILEIYRCVNEALNESLKMANRNASSSTSNEKEESEGSSSSNDKSGSGSSSGHAPNVSADDVLPSLILSVIHAKPSRIVTNLTFLEKFATNEQIQGEAGYAFTNLFGAVQFIKALDLQLEEEEGADNNKNIEKSKNVEDDRRKCAQPTLSMSIELLKEKINDFRQDWKLKEEARASAVKEKEEEGLNDNDDHACKEASTGMESKDYNVNEFKRIEIPCCAVKTARLRGENVDEWAAGWFQEQITLHTNDDSNGQEGDTNHNVEKSTVLDVSSPIDGFACSYSFLATDAKDVKVCDIPELLKEYKMLVRTTETLLMERKSLIQQSKQEEVARKRDKLENSLGTVMNNSSL